jgi:hypothetical protein
MSVSVGTIENLAADYGGIATILRPNSEKSEGGMLLCHEQVARLCPVCQLAHFTYATHVRCFPKGSEGDSEALELCYHDDMLMHEGKYYGDFEIAASFGSDTPKLSPVLGLCENALADLARLDDGTPSVAALHAVRAAIAKATT